MISSVLSQPLLFGVVFAHAALHQSLMTFEISPPRAYRHCLAMTRFALQCRVDKRDFWVCQ